MLASFVYQDGFLIIPFFNIKLAIILTKLALDVAVMGLAGGIVALLDVNVKRGGVL